MTSSDEPRDFLAIRGRTGLKIEPQTARGWRLSIIWMLILLAPTIPFMALAAWVDDTPREHWIIWALAPYLILTGLILWAMIRWMMARADVITREELDDFLRSRRQRASRGRP